MLVELVLRGLLAMKILFTVAIGEGASALK